ncbi:hypothetical protein ACFE04_006498 [Oxalis oulophora]
MKLPKSLLYILSVLCVLVELTKGVVKLPENVTVPAVYVFGDSIVDTGNNNYINSYVKCNYPPYGHDFVGATPTGRFCDGRVPSDIIGEELGVKKLVPPYLKPNLQPQDLITGVVFASGGAGYDPLTAQLVQVLTLQDQLEYFKEYKGKLIGIVGEERAKFILANAVYIIVAGSDDITNNFFALPGRQVHYTVDSYTDLMLNSGTQLFEELYKLGGRRIGAFSAPPIGCVPAQRTAAGGPGRGCVERYNAAAQMFNTKLSKKMDDLTQKYSPDGRFVFIDVYNPLLDLINKPQNYGFKISDRGCCGTGLIEVLFLCNQKTATVCPDVSNHVFWDSFHPTELAYKTLVRALLKKYLSNFL